MAPNEQLPPRIKRAKSTNWAIYSPLITYVIIFLYFGNPVLAFIFWIPFFCFFLLFGFLTKSNIAKFILAFVLTMTLGIGLCFAMFFGIFALGHTDFFDKFNQPKSKSKMSQEQKNRLEENWEKSRQKKLRDEENKRALEKFREKQDNRIQSQNRNAQGPAHIGRPTASGDKTHNCLSLYNAISTKDVGRLNYEIQKTTQSLGSLDTCNLAMRMIITDGSLAAVKTLALQKSSNGQTLLATQSSNLIADILSFFPQPGTRDKPLDFQTRTRYIEITQFLLANGVKPTAVDQDYACFRSTEIKALFQKYGFKKKCRKYKKPKPRN